MINTILTILQWITSHRKIAFKALVGLSVAFLIGWCTILYNRNKKLSESLNNANNNIEAYQGVINNSQQANNVLRLDITNLEQQNDSVIHKLDSVMKNNNIKPKNVNVAATQTQTLNVTKSKGVGGIVIKDSITYKDTTYTDSIKYNDYTTIYYSINKDSVIMRLNAKNEQYLYISSNKEYVNKKSFFKRLFTLDFKKHYVYKYNIINSNDIFKENDVRIIQQTNN